MHAHLDLFFLSGKTQVDVRAMQSPILHSLNVVFTLSSPCGSRHCLEYVNDLIVRGLAWPIAIVLCVLAVMTPSIISGMASRRVWHALDMRARSIPSADVHAEYYRSHGEPYRLLGWGGHDDMLQLGDEERGGGEIGDRVVGDRVVGDRVVGNRVVRDRVIGNLMDGMQDDELENCSHRNGLMDHGIRASNWSNITLIGGSGVGGTGGREGRFASVRMRRKG